MQINQMKMEKNRFCQSEFKLAKLNVNLLFIIYYLLYLNQIQFIYFRPKFRSYNPQNEDLKQNLLPKAVPESGNLISCFSY